MKILRALFFVGGMGLLFASCGAHKGGTCPAYKTDAGNDINPDELAVEQVDLGDLN